MSHAGAITNLKQAVRHLGEPLPKAVTQAIEQATHAREQVAALAPPHPQELGQAIAAALLDGRDPAADPEVQRLSTARDVAPQAAAAVGAWGEAHTVAALAEHADKIIQGWRELSLKAGEALAGAYAVVGDVPLSDSTAFVRCGAEGAVAWKEATAAAEQLETLSQAWAALAAITGFARDNGRSALRLAELPLNTLEKVGHGAKAWDIVRAGGRIELADRTTMPARLERLTEDRHDAERDYARRQQAAVRQEFGVGSTIVA